MGLLGKSFTSKFITITTLAISRIAILMNQHKARASYARSDVAQLLNIGYQDRALLRVSTNATLLRQTLTRLHYFVRSSKSILNFRSYSWKFFQNMLSF